MHFNWHSIDVLVFCVLELGGADSGKLSTQLQAHNCQTNDQICNTNTHVGTRDWSSESGNQSWSIVSSPSWHGHFHILQRWPQNCTGKLTFFSHFWVCNTWSCMPFVHGTFFTFFLTARGRSRFFHMFFTFFSGFFHIFFTFCLTARDGHMFFTFFHVFFTLFSHFRLQILRLSPRWWAIARSVPR